jgi:hypothetical protein
MSLPRSRERNPVAPVPKADRNTGGRRRYSHFKERPFKKPTAYYHRFFKTTFKPESPLGQIRQARRISTMRFSLGGVGFLIHRLIGNCMQLIKLGKGSTRGRNPFSPPCA